MRQLLLIALSLTSIAAPPTARAADGRFFLLVAGEAPQSELVTAAYREVHRAQPPLAPEVARERLGQAYPRLFASGRKSDKSALEGDLKTARAAHFSGQYADAEAAFARALETATQEPELLAGEPALLQRLVDGAATRYKNTLARKRPAPEARTQVEQFLVRFPQSSPTPSDHAPEVLNVWTKAKKAMQGQSGSLFVNVQPIELERGGGCRLFVNGAVLGELPLPGPLELPRGEHFVQVRCGLQIGWLQRVLVGASPLALRMPVRAMIAARGDPTTGGIVLVAPAPDDGAALIQALSSAAELQGAVVARTLTGKIHFGRWESGMDGPTVDAVGRIEGTAIENVHSADEPVPESSGRVWTWVVGGLGLATLTGAVVLNVITADKINDGDQDTEGLKTATIGLYIAGGVLLATGIVLFFVEGDDDGAAAAFVPGRRAEPAGTISAGPGGVVVRF